MYMYTYLHIFRLSAHYLEILKQFSSSESIFYMGNWRLLNSPLHVEAFQLYRMNVYHICTTLHINKIKTLRNPRLAAFSSRIIREHNTTGVWNRFDWTETPGTGNKSFLIPRVSDAGLTDRSTNISDRHSIEIKIEETHATLNKRVKAMIDE